MPVQKWGIKETIIEIFLVLAFSLVFMFLFIPIAILDTLHRAYLFFKASLLHKKH